MRIIHFYFGRCNPNSSNGVEYWIYHVCKQQALLGHSVALFSFTHKPPIPIPGVDVRTYKIKHIPFFLPRNILKDIEMFQPDICNFHSIFIPQFFTLAKKLIKKKIPFVISPHKNIKTVLSVRHRFLKWIYWNIFEKRMFNRAAFIHSVATTTSEFEHFGIKRPVVIIPSSISVSTIPSEIKRNYIRSHYSIPEDKLIFLYLGRINIKIKGIDLLLEGFASAKINNAVLFLVGPANKTSLRHVEKLVKDYKLKDKVIMTGPKYGRDKFDFLASADVFVHTSRSEGFPFAVIEAAALGKPLLITSIVDPLNFFSKYGAAIVVKPNISDIASAFIEFSHMSKDRLITMGKTASRLVRNKFILENNIEDLITAYKKYGSKKQDSSS